MLGPSIERVAAFRIMDVPLGKIGLLAVALGLAAPILGQLYRVSAQIPPLLSGLGVAWGFIRFGKPILGETGAEVMALASGYIGAEGQLGVSRRIGTSVATALGGTRPAVAAPAPSAGTLPTTPVAAGSQLLPEEAALLAAIQTQTA